jgi:hypothetical protein
VGGIGGKPGKGEAASPPNPGNPGGAPPPFFAWFIDCSRAWTAEIEACPVSLELVLCWSITWEASILLGAPPLQSAVMMQEKHQILGVLVKVNEF